MKIPPPEAILYVSFKKENSFQPVDLLFKFAEHSLVNVRFLPDTDQVTLIFDIRAIYKSDVGGSCRGYLYKDNKFLGKLRWSNSDNPMSLDGTYLRRENEIEVRGVAEQLSFAPRDFIIRLSLSEKTEFHL